MLKENENFFWRVWRLQKTVKLLNCMHIFNTLVNFRTLFIIICVIKFLETFKELQTILKMISAYSSTENEGVLIVICKVESL